MTFFKSNKNILLLLIALVVTISCSNTKNKPKNTISKENFKSIMIDLLLTEASYSYLNQQTADLSSQKILDSLYLEIYKKHHTDSTTFKENFNYYINNKNNFLSLMMEVDDSIKILDSIARARNPEIKREDGVATYGTSTEQQLKMLYEQVQDRKVIKRLRDSILHSNKK